MERTAIVKCIRTCARRLREAAEGRLKDKKTFVRLRGMITPYASWNTVDVEGKEGNGVVRQDKCKQNYKKKNVELRTVEHRQLYSTLYVLCSTFYLLTIIYKESLHGKVSSLYSETTASFCYTKTLMDYNPHSLHHL
jgi:hypothetical protein